MKLVLIQWDDPCSTSEPIWQHREGIGDLCVVHCITAGILLSETDSDVRIVLSLNSGDFSQAITISKSSIKRMYYLKVAP